MRPNLYINCHALGAAIQIFDWSWEVKSNSKEDHCMKFSAAVVMLCLASFTAAQNYPAHNGASNPPVTGRVERGYSQTSTLSFAS